MCLAFAESATAGRMAFEFSLCPQSGSILKGGLVCYDASVKTDVLGLDPELIEKFTPESAEVTQAMAHRLQYLIPSDIQVAVTGLTTPGGSENKEKPVGTMFLHINLKHRSIAQKVAFHGSPEEMVLQTIDLLAYTILQALETNVPHSTLES